MSKFRSVDGRALLAAMAALAMLLSVRMVEPPVDRPAAGSGIGTAAAAAPVPFEENRGQSDAAVRFIARGGGYTQFVTDREIVWRLAAGGRAHAVRLSFPGSMAARVHGEGELASRSHYLRGGAAQPVADARQFAAVRLAGLYRGVDLKLHGARARPEYDFLVAPGADPAAIRLRFAGAERLDLDASGALIVRTPAGELIHHRPVAYQTNAGGTQWIDARFVRSGSELRIAVARYDRTRELVIDPVYEYSTYLGGAGSEALTGGIPDPYQAIAVNGAGEAYVAGLTNSADFPTTAGALQPALREDLDFFITKLNAAGDAILFSTYIGGTHDEIGVGGIAVNAAGEILFAGTSQSNDFPVTAGAFDVVANDGGTGFSSDVVALKLNAAGNALVYSTYLGSRSNESLFGFAVDSGGSIVVAGSTVPGTNPEPFPFTGGATINSGGSQFITKIAPDGGSLLWSGSFGTDFPSYVRIRALALDAADNVYLTGLVIKPGLPPLVNALDSTLGGDFDGFVTKINASGTAILYSTLLGGAGTEEPRAIAVDATGAMYVAGSTAGAGGNDFPVTTGAFRTTWDPSHSGFLAKINPAGNALVWSTYLSPPNLSSNNAIAVDAAGRVYLPVSSNPPLDLRVDEMSETCLAYVSAPGLVRVSADGTHLDYGTRVGAPLVFTGGSDITFTPINDLAADSGGNVYLLGTSNSTDFPTYRGAQPSRAGAAVGLSDAYVAKIGDAASLPMPTLSFSAATYSAVETAGTATITVQRTGRAAGPVRVRVQSGGGTAAAPGDYAAVDTTLEWRNGDTTPKTVTVALVNDGVAEGAETLNLTLTKNWCLGDVGAQSTAVLTLNDAGAPPPPPPPIGTLQLSAAAYGVGEGGGNAAIIVTRSGGGSGAVSARLATSNGTAGAGDFTATDVIVNFADGDAAAKTVNVPITQDAADEPDETVNLTLSTPTGGATLGATTAAVLTIADDDPTPAPPPPPPPPAPGGGGGGGAVDALLLALLGLLALHVATRRRRPRPAG